MLEFPEVLVSRTSEGIVEGEVHIGLHADIHRRYLRPAPEGIMVECDVEVVHAGKSLSLLRGSMKREDDGKLISTCEHDKAAVEIKAGFEVPAPAKL